MRDSGTYALITNLNRKFNLRVGQFGIYSLLPGYYVYTGSALGGLSDRLRRHLRSEKRLHWHIDYLLQKATVAQIWYAPGQDKLECTWNTIVMSLPEALLPIRGFGASDCHCYTHLTYFPKVPSFHLFQQKLVQSHLTQVYRINLTQ